MKYLKQMGIILLFCLLGELLSLLPLPIPGAVYGLILMLISLCTGILKPENVADTARFLLQIMPLLFVAPAASLLSHWGVIAPNLLAICVITVVTTFLVFAVSGLVTKACTKKEDRHD